ncbi:MAG: HAMP domain-containing histidine kinase [Cyclobacteriaceae bacterium]|nr:HAMP domain-containing histidine kinase [Cyclobacteriaceae bacterium]
MSRSTLRFVIILAVISIAGITVTQIYWVRRAFDIRENQFYRDVNTALNTVARSLHAINKTPLPATNPVEQISSNYFIVHVNGPVESSVLEFLLVNEFKNRNVTAGFEYGIYDCAEKCMVGGNYISPGNIRSVGQFPETPKLGTDGYYFAVQFPYLEANLISQMGIWGFSSAVTLVVIFFFGYTLFVILKQRRLSEIQKDFINNMTHEFKTPISTIAISAKVLREPNITQTPDRLLNYATIIENENQRLRQQVERVLQVAELDREDIGLKKENLDVHALIEDVVRSRSVGLDGEIQQDLSASTFHVSADRLHLSNVFYNLLDNAIKYCQVRPHVHIQTSNPDPHHLEVAVIDNGIGMKPSEQNRIFDKFYRVPTGNVHNVKGFGLGLSYVKEIITRHRGRIRVESAPGQGSTFHVILPLAPSK